MSGRGPAIVVAVVVALAGGAATVVATCAPRAPGAAARSEAFQALVGGVGGGPATTMARCARAFDPRLDDACAFRTHPTPAGGAYCAHGLAGLPDR
ncbi:MAG: hypothetical protein JNM10_06180 [Planctomycetia bacterium]|nr:hypothetical protein [Planctomycetia bacterium]